MKRLSGIIALVLLAPSTGNASLENDAYFSGGYFAPTIFLSGYFPEGDPGPPPSTTPDASGGGFGVKDIQRLGL